MGRESWRWKKVVWGSKGEMGCEEVRGGYYARQREKVAEVLLRDWGGVFLVRLG